MQIKDDDETTDQTAVQSRAPYLPPRVRARRAAAAAAE